MKKDAYRHTARWYDAIFRPVNAGLLAVGRKMAPPVPGTAVLDVGCGTGEQLAPYQKAGCHVWGLDSSPAMLARAQAKLGQTADLRLGDATQMPYADNTFDLIMSTLVLHEMAQPVREGTLAEMKRVLKQNGQLLLIDFHPGPIRIPVGWFNKAFITLSEIAAGREHFRNYRDFIKRRGLLPLLAGQELHISRQRIVSGGNMILLLAEADYPKIG